jgi:hypothetical protein
MWHTKFEQRRPSNCEIYSSMDYFFNRLLPFLCKSFHSMGGNLIIRWIWHTFDTGGEVKNSTLDCELHHLFEGRKTGDLSQFRWKRGKKMENRASSALEEKIKRSIW